MDHIPTEFCHLGFVRLEDRFLGFGELALQIIYANIIIPGMCELKVFALSRAKLSNFECNQMLKPPASLIMR